MKINNYRQPESSFLSVDKDMDILMGWLLKNQRFCKMLYQNVPEALDKPDLSEEQIVSMMDKNIKNVPKILVDSSVLNYIIISFDNFTPNGHNPQFRDNTIIFDIICHFDQWKLKDSQLRPYRLAAEIDSTFNGRHLTGIGKLDFMAINQIILNDEFGGLSLMYSAIHGGEDKYGMPNPEDNAEFIKDFNELFNSDMLK